MEKVLFEGPVIPLPKFLELLDSEINFRKKVQQVNEQIKNNYMYHAPKESQAEKYDQLRSKAKELAYLIDELCPNSREKALANTNLEQSIMWANASVARN